MSQTTRNNPLSMRLSDLERVNGVANVSFTTKDQALENFQNSMSSTDIVDQLDGTNPLPASILVELSDPPG